MIKMKDVGKILPRHFLPTDVKIVTVKGGQSSLESDRHSLSPPFTPDFSRAVHSFSFRVALLVWASFQTFLSRSVQAATTEYQRLGSLNNRHLFLMLLGAEKSKIKVLVDSVSSPH